MAALALVLPVWGAALIVAAIVFAAAGIAVLTGKKQVDKVPPPAAESVDSVKSDIDQIEEASHGSRN